MSLRNFKTIKERQDYLKTNHGISLKALKIYPPDLEIAQMRNCENMIGAVSVPLGLAGPLKINGLYAKKEYFIPLATTEGALVASVNRGTKALNLCGGAEVQSEYQGITRGPVFKTRGIKESLALKEWIKAHKKELAKVAGSTSSHLSMKETMVTVTGRNVYVRFSFDTMDAMGMNMVTIAVTKIAAYIKDATGQSCLSVAGNFDTDKKPSWLNFIAGRGRQVWAEAKIPMVVVEKVLKTTPQALHNVCQEKCLMGSIVSGSLGFNAHFANVVAAVFMATGQDAAHTVEGSLGITSTDIVGEDLYISVYLPDLILGTVGGGTALPAQREALSILGITGGNQGKNAALFSEIVGGAVLAGELSLLASLAEGSLGEAHAHLARGKRKI